MSRIKICGLRRKTDIEYANLCLPDYVGFVFAPSPRRVDARTAAALKSLLDPRILAVGVFVNEEISVIRRLCEERTIDLIQLHGDEDDAYMRALKAVLPHPLIRAVAIHGGDADSDDGANSGGHDSANAGRNNGGSGPDGGDENGGGKGGGAAPDFLSALAPAAEYLLFDAYGPDVRGGGGKRFRWETVRHVRRPYFLAGGLAPANVAAAIRQLSPYCVDMSSGVETDGCKDLEKMKAVTAIVRDSQSWLRPRLTALKAQSNR
jgi:phosphoribosylanthranilate isomerase